MPTKMTKSRYRVFAGVAAILSTLTIGFLLILFTVPDGLVLRGWFFGVGIVGVMFWQGLIIWTEYLLYSRVFGRSETKAAKHIGRALSVILTIIIIGFLAFLWLVCLVASRDEMLNENGTITVADSGFLQETQYSLWSQEGILYRKYIREAASPEDNDPSMTKKMFLMEHYPEMYEEKEGEQESASQVPQIIPAGTNRYDDEVEFLGITDGMAAIYHQIAGNDPAYSYRASMTAKGVPRAVLFEDDHVVRSLLYDRISKNNECFLYVYYESEKDEIGAWSSSEGQIQILEMYAYVIDDGKVIPSGRQAWSDIGSNEYREAIGE